MRYFHALLLGLMIIFFKSCDDSNDISEIAIYKAENPQFEKYPCALAKTPSLETSPVITNEEILKYNSKTHTMTISDSGVKKFKDLKDWDILAITLDNDPVFFMVNKPYYSSSICFNMISSSALAKEIILNFIIDQNAAVTSIDNRNDKNLIKAFDKQGKLDP
jgi:hypothetical protein